MVGSDENMRSVAGGDLAELLQHLMICTQRRDSDLARLTGIPARTIEKWRQGVVRRPRLVTDLLKLARALNLDAAETTALLQAARHPSLDLLREHAQQTHNHTLAALLAAWPAARADPARTSVKAELSPMLPPRHQLRPPVADFVGRAHEVAQLVMALQTAVAQRSGAVIAGVHGMGGVGKTELAYYVAHQLRETFSDAQIVVAFHGSSAAPLPVEQALQTVIRIFTPDAALPDDLTALQPIYHSVLHTQRVLILADDVRDAAHVRALIPPVSCALLITSRQRFTLPGMINIYLEQFGVEEAVTFLRSICDRLSGAEAQTIAHACGYLPLALRVSGGILHNNPALSVATYLAQLADTRQRLQALRDPDDPHLNVEAALALSYAQLDSTAQQVFQQLGVFVSDFTTPLACAVVAVDTRVDVETRLHQLLRRNLIMYDRGRMRWRLHDLVRDVARGRLEAAGEQEGAMWRYAQAAVQIATEAQVQYHAGGDGMLASLVQFDTERPHIDAAWRWSVGHAETPAGDRLLVDHVLAMIDISELRYDARCDRIPRLEAAYAAAHRLGDRRGEVQSLNYLGYAYMTLGDIRRAIPYLEHCLTIARESGDRHESMVLCNLGNAYVVLGDAARAIPYLEQRLIRVRERGNRRAEGIASCNLGNAYMALGDAARAIPYLEHGLTVAREVRDRRVEGVVLGNLAMAYVTVGDGGRAREACTHALRIAQEVGDRRSEGYALSYMGCTYAGLGDVAQALMVFEQALAILREIGDRHGATECGWHYGLFLAQQGKRARALLLLRDCVAYEQEIGHAHVAAHAALLARLEAGEALSGDPALADAQ